MPTLLVWTYTGGEDGSEDAERRGEQRAYPGDTIVDDVFGKGEIVRLDGTEIVATFDDGDAEGEQTRSQGHVYALANRDRQMRAPAAAKKKGVSGTPSIFQMIGRDATPTPPITGQKRAAPGAAAAPTGQKRAAPAAAAAPTAAQAASPAPAAAAPTAAQASPAPAAANPLAALLGAEYDDDDSDAEEANAGAAHAAKKVATGGVPFNKLDKEGKADYRRDKYEARKSDDAKQAKMAAPYLHSLDQPNGWLVKDSLRGWHCRFCIGKTIKPSDKLTGGYGYAGEGELRVLVPIKGSQKLSNHADHAAHKLNVLNAAKLAAGKPQSAVMGDANVYLTITPEDELYARSIRTLHTIVICQLPLHDMTPLLQLQQANGMVISFDHVAKKTSGEEYGGGLSDWLVAGVRVFKAMQRERVQNSIMVSLFPNGVPLGLLGDGSTDRSMYEQEAVVTRHLGANGKPFNAFHDLAELDLKQSADGRSPDAICLTECYAGSLDELNAHEGYLLHSDWRRALIGAAFDGASVMLGSKNGVVKRLRDKVLPAKRHMISIHAVAHLEQLANADAFLECEYFEEWRGDLQEVYVMYNGSGKKRFGLEEIANKLDASLLKINSTHGIRWAASQALNVKALLKDLSTIVADLEVAVKSEKGLTITLLTPSENFLNKRFTQSFGPRSRWKATVVDFTHCEGSDAYDMFELRYTDKSTMKVSKAELVALLTDEAAAGLNDDARWQLRTKLITYRFVCFSGFILDVHEQLAILSKSFQSNALLIFDISKNINKTLAQLKKLLDKPGSNEQVMIRP